MFNKTESSSLSLQKKHLAVILFSYTIFALIFAFAYRYLVTPDGISLLRSAGYLSEGYFQRSVNIGWSPLFTWLMAPLLFLGIEGLTAVRITTALCGAGLLICSWFFTRRFDLSPNNRFIAVMIMALTISYWTILTNSPDVLFAALILFYLYLVTDPDILESRKASFYCGIVGAFSYLAHHYAFPFFLAHFPAILLLRGYMLKDKGWIQYKKILTSWGVGITGFLLISAIWISVVSVKYGHLSITSKGGIVHAIMGPKDMDRRHPFFIGGLFKPRDDYAIHVFEDPSDVKFKTWSPFESREYFIHQVRLIKDNFVYILNHFVNKSPFFVYAFVIGILAIVPIGYLLNPLNERKKFMYLWIVITFSIYSSGFVLTLAKSPRRFYALMIVFVFLSFHFLEEIINGAGSIMTDRRKKILNSYLLLIIVLAFSLKPGMQLLKAAKNDIAANQINPYKEIAEQIEMIAFPAPYAIIRSSQKPHTDTYIAYYLKKQLLGRPLSQDVDGITKELETASARSLLVFDNPALAEKLKNDNRYLHAAYKKLKDNSRYEHTVNININDHEIVTGWDKEINVFILK